MVKYKVGDCVQFKNNGNPFMWGIQLYNLRKFKEQGPNHVGIISRIEGNTIWIAEAIGTVPFQEFEYDVNWIEARVKEGKMWIQRSTVPLKNVYEVIQCYFGRKYDWIAIWGILFKFLFGFHSPISKKFKGEDMLICSEAVFRILYDCSGHKIDVLKEYGIKEADWVTPMHLFKSKFLKLIE
jgi:hypothetical protein